jgi:hypothetical protein
MFVLKTVFSGTEGFYQPFLFLLGVPRPRARAPGTERAPPSPPPGGSGSRRLAPSELQRLPPKACFGGSVVALHGIPWKRSDRFAPFRPRQ